MKWPRCWQRPKNCHCGPPAWTWSPRSTAFTTSTSAGSWPPPPGCWQPGGQLFIYTRTPQQNARTIWGRYFPGFTEHEQRLHSEAAIRDAVRRTDGLTVAATQTFHHPRTSTAERLRAQAEGRHYSTFSLYTPQELRAAIAVFLACLPSREVSWIDEHLLVIADRRRNHAEPDGPASPANQAITGRALQISARRSGQAPQAVPAAARRPPRNAPSRSLPTTFSRASITAAIARRPGQRSSRSASSIPERE